MGKGRCQARGTPGSEPGEGMEYKAALGMGVTPARQGQPSPEGSHPGLQGEEGCTQGLGKGRGYPSIVPLCGLRSSLILSAQPERGLSPEEPQGSCPHEPWTQGHSRSMSKLRIPRMQVSGRIIHRNQLTSHQSSHNRTLGWESRESEWLSICGSHAICFLGQEGKGNGEASCCQRVGQTLNRRHLQNCTRERAGGPLSRPPFCGFRDAVPAVKLQGPDPVGSS